MDDDLNKLAIGINESFHLIMNCINKTQGFGIKETKEKYTTSMNQLFLIRNIKDEPMSFKRKLESITKTNHNLIPKPNTNDDQ